MLPAELTATNAARMAAMKVFILLCVQLVLYFAKYLELMCLLAVMLHWTVLILQLQTYWYLYFLRLPLVP